MICFTSFPLCRLLVNSRTRSRSFLVAFGLGHRCMKCQRGFRCMLRFLRIVQPRNTKLSFPRLKSTSRVFAGCSVSPSRFITNPIRRSASLACDSVRHIATKSSAVANQDSQLATPRRPDPIQLVQVDVGQQRRDHSALRCSRQRFSHRAILHHSALPTIGGSTSTPFDPRSAPSPTPSGFPSGCCQSSLECPHPRQSCDPGCLLHGSLPEPASHSSSAGIHNCMAGSPLRRSARSPSSPPSAPLDPAPSVSPTAAASHLLSVCIAASPGKDDIGLPATPPRSPPETLPRLVVRWPGSSPRRSPPRRRCCALASMLPTERHSCRSGRTAHGTAVSYSAWHTHIACVGVVVLFRWGCWPFPACPRTYLLTSSIKARPLPSSALSCTPSSVLRTSRTPSRLRATSAFRPYTPGLCPTWLPGRVSPVPRCSVPNVPPPETPERSSIRSGPECCLLPSP